MIDNLIKSRFLPRIGLVTGAYVFWAGVFVALSPGDESAAESFVAIPIVLSALLFGVRGAITGSTIGFIHRSPARGSRPCPGLRATVWPDTGRHDDTAGDSRDRRLCKAV